MEAIQRAAYAVSSFITLKPGFQWSSFLDAPDPIDQSPEANTKRAILLAASEQLASPSTLFDENLYELAQETIVCWPVQRDWMRFLNAIEHLALVRSSPA